MAEVLGIGYGYFFGLVVSAFLRFSRMRWRYALQVSNIPVELTTLADWLYRACPNWNVRVMAFGGRQAVVIDISSISRTLVYVAGGHWVVESSVFDADDDPIPQLSTTHSSKVLASDVSGMYALIMRTVDAQYEKALGMSDTDPFVAIRDAARVNLPLMRQYRQ